MTGPHDDVDGAPGDDDRRAVGTPAFSVQEGIAPLPGPRATGRTGSRVGRWARVWDDLAELDIGDMDDLEDVA